MDLKNYKARLSALSSHNYGVDEATTTSMLMSSRTIPDNTTLEALDYNEPISTELFFKVYNRTIEIGTGVKDIVVQGDTNSRKLTFELDRYFDDIDLSTKSIRIYYINADGKFGYFPIDNAAINPTDEEKMTIVWVMDGTVTAKDGNVSFAIDFYETDGDGVIVYRWQTTAAHFNIEKAIAALEAAQDPDYTFLISFVSQFTGHINYEELKAELQVEIDGREVVMPSTENLVVKRDTMSRGIEFSMPRYYDGVDMSTKIILIQFLNANKEPDCCAAVNVSSNDEYLFFTWIIDGNATAYKGMVTYSIAFIGYSEHNDFYVWQTKLGYIFVEDGLNVIEMLEKPSPSWLHSLQIQMDSIIKQSQYYLAQTIQINQELQEDLDAAKKQIEDVKAQADKISQSLLDQAEELKAATEAAQEVIKNASDRLDRIDTVLDAIFQNTLSSIEIAISSACGIKLEHGRSVAGNVLSWSFTPAFAPTSQEINGIDVGASSNQYNDLNFITKDTTYVLVVKDAIRTLSEKLTIRFYDSVRWGTALEPASTAVYDSSFLKG